jgi:hypothetical protein
MPINIEKSLKEMAGFLDEIQIPINITSIFSIKIFEKLENLRGLS